MSKKRQYTKEAIENAVKFVLNKEGSERKAALKFGVPRSSIQFKIKNPGTKFKSGPYPVLTESEENALCDFIIELAERGFPRKKDDIQLCVQDFLKKNPRPNPFRNDKPGDVWFNAFMKRHPNLSFRTSEGVTNASACVSETDIRKWFREISEYIDKGGLTEAIQDPARIFNSDETGFNICPKTGKVVAEKGSKNVYQVEKGSAKENITVMFTFSAAGQIYKPMIIYPYLRIPDRISLSVPRGWGIGRSEKGWMTATVFQDFIENCFYPQLVANRIPFPVILFVDGHKTHLTIEVSELCRNLQIHLIALYPNATRILQPADVAAFRPIKAGWRKGLREWYADNNYCVNLNKESFAPLLQIVVDATAKSSTLVNGFRVTGLYPFDANNVDYSKCIASSKDIEQLIAPAQVTSVAEIDDENNLCILTYPEFCNIIGKKILEQCLTATVLTLQRCDENFTAIYKLWKKFNSFTDEDNVEMALKNQENQFVDYGIDDPTLIINNNYIPSPILDECTGVLIIPEQEKVVQKSFIQPLAIEKDASKIQLITQNTIPMYGRQRLAEINEIDEKKSMIEIEKEELSSLDCIGSVNVIEDLNEKVHISNTVVKNEKQKIIQENILNIEEKCCSNTEKAKKENTIEKSALMIEIPCCSTAVNKQITVVSNEPLTEYLQKQMRPIAPVRQGKRNTEKLPFALTSDSYVEIVKAKQLKKQEEEAAKENRKRLREEKKKQKENAPYKQKKNNKKNERETKTMKPLMSKIPAKKKYKANELIIICCDICLSPITRRIIECSQCNKRFHLHCIPSSHRIHIPEDDDDGFLCHFCYKESNSDLSYDEELELEEH